MVNFPYFAANQLSLQLAATEYRLAAGRESSYEVGLVGSTWLTPALRGSWINTLGYGTDRSIVSRSTLGLEYFSSPSARLTFSGEAGLGQSVRTDTFDPGTGQSDRGAIGNGAFVQIALRWYPY